MRKDFENLKNGSRILLHPHARNPLHKKPVPARHLNGRYYCEGTDPTDWPDYCALDVAVYNDGFTDTEE